MNVYIYILHGFMVDTHHTYLDKIDAQMDRHIDK